MVSQGDHKARLPVITRFAVGELKGALQRHPAPTRAFQRQALKRYRAVQQLQLLVQAGVPRGFQGEFTRLESVLPEPDKGSRLYISGLSWAPDGQSLIFSSNHEGQSNIYLISLDGQAWTNLTKDMDGDAVWPIWRP